MVQEGVRIGERTQERTISDFLKTYTNWFKNKVEVSNSITFFSIPTIDIPTSTEIKEFSI